MVAIVTMVRSPAASGALMPVRPASPESWLAIAPSEDAGVVLTGASTADDWYWTGRAKVAPNASTATPTKTMARRQR